MRVRGEGTLERHGGDSFRFRFNLGRDRATGTYRYSPWRTVHGTKADARRAMEEYRRELECGLRVDLKGLTFAEYARLFADNRESMGNLAKGTISCDRSLIKYIDRYLGGFALWDIDALLLKDAYARMVQEDAPSKSKLHDVMGKVKQILRSAMIDNVIIRNPADGLRIPSKPKPKRRSLSRYEAGALLSALGAAAIDRNTVALRIGLATGMRRGEVLGLRWQDIDLTNNSIHVRNALDRSKNLKAPKTDRSGRKLSIDGSTAQGLHAWKARQAADLLAQGIRQDGDTYVCSNGQGGPCEPSRFYKWFRNFCVDNGFAVYVDGDGNELPRRFNGKGFPIDGDGRPYSRSNRAPKVKRFYRGLKFHELRHTQATLLIANGTDIKTVQDRLGHANASMTLDFYAHSQDEQDRAASELFSSLLTEDPPEKRVVGLH
jgi:integrase